MENNEDNNKAGKTKESAVVDESKQKQQQTDPQKTELKGFFDKDEKLEPDLEKDGNEDKE